MPCALSTSEAKKELQRAHELLCGDNSVSLYRRLQRKGYYGLEIPEEATDLHPPARDARSL